MLVALGSHWKMLGNLFTIQRGETLGLVVVVVVVFVVVVVVVVVVIIETIAQLLQVIFRGCKAMIGGAVYVAPYSFQSLGNRFQVAVKNSIFENTQSAFAGGAMWVSFRYRSHVFFFFKRRKSQRQQH